MFYNLCSMAYFYHDPLYGIQAGNWKKKTNHTNKRTYNSNKQTNKQTKKPEETNNQPTKQTCKY